jgi:hypothetical protein
LGEVLGAVQIAGHPRAESLDGRLPPLDEAREGGVVVRVLHAPHRLLVGDGEGPGHRSAKAWRAAG